MLSGRGVGISGIDEQVARARILLQVSFTQGNRSGAKMAFGKNGGDAGARGDLDKGQVAALAARLDAAAQRVQAHPLDREQSGWRLQSYGHEYRLYSLPWHCLNFLPEPHQQGSLRPILRSLRT